MNKSICITGHRPNKLGGYDWNSVKNIAIRDYLYWLFEKEIIENNVIRFITGGAIGADQLAFSMLNKLQQRCFHQIELILAIPFEEQYVRWSVLDKFRHMEHKDLADEVIYVDELPKYAIKNAIISRYHPLKMQKRNQYMVDNSDKVIALWNGTKSGTANCINYAKSQQKEVFIINPDTI